ncbi:MAG TPA: hypothetical protein VFB81_00885, partial [Myxococcales bacterium]|nr:hypothetical protein [Myxococcales bacterium]
MISACGMDQAPGASSSAIAEPRAAAAGAWFCDHTVTGAVDIQPLVGFLEIDRTYLTDRPGFQLMWASLGAYPDGTSFGQVFLLFDDTARAQEFDGWLDQEYDLGGIPFWQRPSLAGGHECFVAEVIDGQGRPSNKASQVVMRTERFPAQG